MPNRLSFTFASSAFFALGLLALPSPAFAGFQWIAPTDNAMPGPAVQTWPQAPMAATAAPEIISPVIITGNNAPPAMATPTVPMAPSVSAMPRETLSTSSSMSAPPMPMAAPMGGKQMPSPATATTTTLSTAPASDVVHGFAKQVPLAVALRQILPAGYGFSVDPDVDLGVLISFQGGKPWRDTLRDALEPAGLVVHEQGQMVSVGHSGSMSMTETVSTAPPMPTPHTVDVPPGTAPQMPPPLMMETKGPVVEDWHAERGDNLHKIVEAWAERAHVELNWMAEYDYPLEASFSYTGTFEDAVRNLLTGFEEAHPQPVAELHANPGLGLKVLIVQTRGNSYTN